jgi:site-specific recombinase XerD
MVILITFKSLFMNQSFKVLFRLKPGKRNDEQLPPIYVRLTVDGDRVEWSISKKCDKSNWNPKTGRAIGNKEETKTLNGYLDAIQANIFSIQKEYALRNEPVTAQVVRARILHQTEEKQYSLLEVFSYHNEQFEKLVGAEYSYGTLKKFRTALTSLQKFIEWKYSKTDLYINEVNHKFITDYEFYLKTVQKLQHNSAMSNIKKLKKIIRLCVANDWLSKDPFKSYKITTKETHRNFLLKEELDILMNKEIEVVRLDQVRDIFLFSCYTGLSYSDVMNLTQKDITIGIDGEQWIFTTRTKTDTSSRIPLLPVPKSIIEKYKHHPKVIHSKKLLPQLSNQRLNTYLKEISSICGFHKDLTFHCARHTFATTITLTNGVPIETVGKMLGHKSLRTTQQYARILDRKVSEDMQVLRQKLLLNPDQQVPTQTNSQVL